MSRTRFLAAALVAVVALPLSVRGAETGRSRDTIALPGERVEVVAAFAPQGGVGSLLIDGKAAGSARQGPDGWLRFAIAAPGTPGVHALVFGLGSAEARANLLVLDARKPSLIVDTALLAGRPDAKAALATLAKTHQIVYLTEGSSDALRSLGTIGQDLPAGAHAKVRAGGLATWLRGLSSRGVRFTTGLARTSAQAVVLHNAGVTTYVAPPSLTAVANQVSAAAGASAPAFTPRAGAGELEGTWEVLDPSGARKGVIDFTGQGPTYAALRDHTTSGVATLSGGELDIAYQNPGSTGFSGAMVSVAGGSTITARDHYERDPVEGSFVGAHAGRPESLRRSVGGNSVELLVDGAEMLPAYLAAIQTAQRSIHIESYIWRDETAGQAIVNALCERARAGVAVRAIFDGVGSLKAKTLRDRIAASGGRVVNYNPVSLSNAGAFLATIGEVFRVFTGQASARDSGSTGIDHRDHRKVLVVDGATGFTGGIGFADDDMYEWHDLHARVRGPSVAKLQQHFEESWAAGGGGPLGEDPAATHPPLASAGDLALDVVTTVPGVRTEIKRAYLAKIAAASREVLIENPYFTDDEVIGLLKAKARQGVAVTVVLPVDAKNDVSMVGNYHAKIRPDLWAAGIELRDYPKMTHGKVAVVDGTWSTIGSCNLDNRSLARNLEINVTCDDPKLASLMRFRVFDPDIRASARWTPASPPRTFMQKLWGTLASAVRDWL